MGYLKQDEKTAESFKVVDGVRWFSTGDIGEVQPDGVFRIIGKYGFSLRYHTSLRTGTYCAKSKGILIISKKRAFIAKCWPFHGHLNMIGLLIKDLHIFSFLPKQFKIIYRIHLF